MKTEFTAVGGDARFDRLAKLLHIDGYGVKRVNERELQDSLMLKGAVILPYPCVKNGKLSGTDCPLEDILSRFRHAGVIFAGGAPACLIDFARKNNIKIIDYSLREELLLANAALTAEAAIALVMGSSESALRGKNVIVCGYGRIGKALSAMLCALGAKVIVASRSFSSHTECELRAIKSVFLTELEEYIPDAKIVFNTIPAPVIGSAVLEKAQKDCRFIDLASSPGGVDFTAAEKLGLSAVLASGLPGKYAPLSAAKIIKNAIYNSIEEERLFS